MTKARLEAFSDGVFAVIITIMVLEMKVPTQVTFAALRAVLPVFLSYVLSFVYVGIYWNNHHHLLHAAQKVNGRILWPISICSSGFRWCPSPLHGWEKTRAPQRQ